LMATTVQYSPMARLEAARPTLCPEVAHCGKSVA